MKKSTVFRTATSAALCLTLTTGAVMPKEALAWDWLSAGLAVFQVGAQYAYLNKQVNYLDNKGRDDYMGQIKDKYGVNSDPTANAMLARIMTRLSDAVALTDDSIAWWLEKNPDAETRATRLNFGALDEESSLVAGFKAARSRDKDSSRSFTAALFDIRDYTVIVAYSKTYKNYILVWCEPVCQNKNRDKLLNSIYFEDDASLALFYYKGKTTFKYHVNLASRTIRR